MATSQSSTLCSPVEYRDLAPLGFPGYRVGSDGTVWTCLVRTYPGGHRVGVRYVCGGSWLQLSPSVSGKGRYPKVGLRRTGGVAHRRVCTLVLLAFVGPCPAGMECCHFDDDPTNNCLSNLRWDTRFANAADKHRNGRSPVGSRNPKHQLTEDDIPKIFEMRSRGMFQKDIGAALGVAEGVIGSVLRGVTWKHVPRPSA